MAENQFIQLFNPCGFTQINTAKQYLYMITYMLEITRRVLHNCDFKDVISNIWERTDDLIASFLISVNNISLSAASYESFSLIHFTLLPELEIEDSRYLLAK